MVRYTGPKPCPGCGCPGSEKSRFRVDENCTDCKNLIILGRETRKRNTEDQTVYVTCNIYPFYISGGDVLYNEIRKLALSLNDETKRSVVDSSQSMYIGSHSSNGGAYVVVTKTQAEALKALYNTVATTLPAIYNKGKEDGQNLLMQLANGSITLDKFDEQKKR